MDMCPPSKSIVGQMLVAYSDVPGGGRDSFTREQTTKK
jgi:hypothetical protein